MYNYNAWQWIIFFAIYCLIGWAGESLYVSLEHKKWVNRGFMHGPILPIYGSGAIIILFATLPVRDNFILIFIFGMMSATILEYFTGYAMEKIFKVRYWDYTIQPFNLNGYICLGCSVTWGIAAELLINLIHKPIEEFVLRINDVATIVLALCFAAGFGVDLFVSVNEAFDLRRIIVDAIENNENLRRIERRMDVFVAFADDDKRRFAAYIEKLKNEKERRSFFLAFDIAEAKLEFYEKLQDKKKEHDEDVERIRRELAQSRKRHAERAESWHRKSAERILKRNPGANAKRHGIDIEKVDDDFKA